MEYSTPDEEPEPRKRVKHKMSYMKKLQNLTKESNLSEKVGMVSHFLIHPGQKKLYTTMRPYWSSPGLKKAIMEQRKNCIHCQRNLVTPTHVPKTKNLGHLSTTEPFKHICSDIFGPFELPRTTKKRWIITITDRCTRWTKVLITTKVETRVVIRALLNWTNEFGAPEMFLMIKELSIQQRKLKPF